MVPKVFCKLGNFHPLEIKAIGRRPLPGVLTRVSPTLTAPSDIFLVHESSEGRSCQSDGIRGCARCWLKEVQEGTILGNELLTEPSDRSGRLPR